jgi:hypothetical protein
MTSVEQVAQRRNEVQALVHLWEIAISHECPSEPQFFLWLDLHSFDCVSRAIRQTARKQFNRKTPMTPDHLIRFCSTVANELEREARAKPGPDHRVEIAMPASA